MPASPSLGNLGVPGRKPERSSSMVAHGHSSHVYFDESAVASSSGSQPGNNAVAPTSVPPDLATGPAPPVIVSSLDAQQPRIFPGVVSKSRKSSVATSTRPGSATFAEGYDQAMMAQSMASISRVRSDEKSEDHSAAIDEDQDEEDEVGEV